MVASSVAAIAAVALFERWLLAGIHPADPTDDPVAADASVASITFATADGGRLYVEDQGAGPPIVLLHGHGATLGIFSRLAPRLAAGGRRVVSLDQRGFGRSSPVPDGFAFDGLVQDVVTLLETLDLRGATIVGHSMGGAVALGLAINHPTVVDARVGGLVLLNSTARGPADHRLNRAMVKVQDWPGLERLGRHPRHGLALSRTNFGVDPLLHDVEAVRRIGLESPTTARRGFARRLLGTDLSADLHAVQAPVLVVAGSHDRVIGVGESERLAARLPDVALHVFPGAGHVLPLERVDAVTDLVLGFAAERERR